MQNIWQQGGGFFPEMFGTGFSIASSFSFADSLKEEEVGQLALGELAWLCSAPRMGRGHLCSVGRSQSHQGGKRIYCLEIAASAFSFSSCFIQPYWHINNECEWIGWRGEIGQFGMEGRGGEKQLIWWIGDFPDLRNGQWIFMDMLTCECFHFFPIKLIFLSLYF
jgi:hypothetical protein